MKHTHTLISTTLSVFFQIDRISIDVAAFILKLSNHFRYYLYVCVNFANQITERHKYLRKNWREKRQSGEKTNNIISMFLCDAIWRYPHYMYALCVWSFILIADICLLISFVQFRYLCFASCLTGMLIHIFRNEFHSNSIQWRFDFGAFLFSMCLSF